MPVFKFVNTWVTLSKEKSLTQITEFLNEYGAKGWRVTHMVLPTEQLDGFVFLERWEEHR